MEEKQAQEQSHEPGPRERVYDEFILPLMSQIAEVCAEHDIPYVASFELDSHDDDPLFCTSYSVTLESSYRMQTLAKLMRPR